MDTYCMVSIYFPRESGLVQCTECTFFTDKHCVLPGGNCTIHRINTELHTGVNNGLCTASQTPPGTSRHIKQRWGLENKESLPVSIGNMGLCIQVPGNKCLAIRPDKGLQARFLFARYYMVCLKKKCMNHKAFSLSLRH